MNYHCQNLREILLYIHNIYIWYYIVTHGLISVFVACVYRICLRISSQPESLHSWPLQTGTFLVSYLVPSVSVLHIHLHSLTCVKVASSPHYRLAAGASVTFRPLPAMGRSLSSHRVTPSQAQICLGFWNKPADRAMIPHASLRKERERADIKQTHTVHWRTLNTSEWALHRMGFDFSKSKYQGGCFT